jgi:hypothetical protein
MEKTTTQHFARASDALIWLYNNCGLWKGLSPEVQKGIYELLDWQGNAFVRTPSGDMFVAVMEKGPKKRKGAK